MKSIEDKSDKKVLMKLKEDGWKQEEIKYAPFKVYKKDNFCVLYSIDTDRIILKYSNKRTK